MSMSQITPTLFLSGADAPLNHALVARKGITLIVNATLSHSCPRYPGVECLRVAVPDLPSAHLGGHFDRVAARIHNNRAGGTLVHCAAGMSRSPALIMAYLMKYRGTTLQEAHSWVRRSRPCVCINAGFWEQLLTYEKKLYGRNTVKLAVPLETPPQPITPRMPRRQSLRQCPASPRLNGFRRTDWY
ncbi:dual specificity protein phosphatase 14 isoform X2 [Brachyhypopomus gauderio]|uniref:dual specificity protein phosphatase 14 isoform X2 n=1 Tax=Brachyhypopomus gauderio TaxID=698409 RepID=UPI0040427B90